MIFTRPLLALYLSIALQTSSAIASFHRPSDAPGNDVSSSDPVGLDKNRYIVKFKNQRGKGVAEAAASRVHVQLTRHGAMAASFPPQALNGLRNNPNIEYIEQDAPRLSFANKLKSLRGGEADRKQDDERKLAETVPYGIPLVQAAMFTDANDKHGEDITTCIIDSGYDSTHPDLPNSATGYDGNLPWNIDGYGHGTHVAGTIAAQGNDVGVVGVAPNTDLYIVRVFGDDGAWAYSSSLIDALDRCVSAGAKVVNMSLGGGRRSKSEDRAFAKAYASGVLSIAAAGNDGDTSYSYPASYDSVVSVGALDENKLIAGFSQKNDQVDISAPGVDVLSTVSYYPILASLTTSIGAVSARPYGRAIGSAENKTFVYCGLAIAGQSEGDCASGGLADQICLVERGDISFADKAAYCVSKGYDGFVIYNNAHGMFQVEGLSPGIPGVSISQEDGQSIRDEMSTADVTGNIETFTSTTKYTHYSGTSMAAPHVVGVAALVWSNHLSCSNDEILQALTGTAFELGAAGKDDAYGVGLVQAKAASDYLDANPCGGSGPTPPAPTPPPPTPPTSCACGTKPNGSCRKCRGP